MKVVLLAILLSLAVTGVAAQQVRGESIDTNNDLLSLNDESHHFLRHGKDGGKDIEEASRELHWAQWKKSPNKRSSDSGCTKEEKLQRNQQKREPYSWIYKYRKWARKWRKKQREKNQEQESDYYYENDSGVFKIKLPLLSSKTVGGYKKSVKKLKRDLTEAGQFQVKLLLERSNKGYNYRGEVDIPPQLALPSNEGGDSSPTAGEVDSFDTNTVEDDIDEGDLLKVSSDGKYAFTVFGGNVVIWDTAKGNETVTTEAMPKIENVNQPPGPIPIPRPIPLVREPQVAGEEEEEEGEEEEEPEMNQSGGQNRRDLQFAPDSLYYCWGPVVPTIHSLMTYKNKLAVVISGYGPSIRNELDYKPVFYDAFNTKVRIYDISTLDTTGELTFEKEFDIHGRFDSIRAIENKIHIVTFSQLDTYTFIEGPLDRNKPEFRDMEDDEYRKAARRLAKRELIPDFVDRVVEDLSVHGRTPDLARVAMFATHVSSDPKLEETLFPQGIIRYYAQVTSFDILDPVAVSEAGSFMPTGYGHTYANERNLIIAGQGWDYSAQLGGSRQTTYFLGFALQDNGQAVPATVGSTEGHLLNEFSVDIVDDHMRIAVTIRRNMWRFPLLMETSVERDIPPTQNLIKVFKIPDVDNTDFDGTGPLLKEVGSTESLGEENEVFTAVRFSDKVAYAVTFFQTDPFYVISFENATNPEVLGELKISGFSSYLHVVQDDENATLLLGVGQEADNEGRAIGLQVSYYNATNRTSPSLIDRFPFELDKNVYSSSTAEFDYKAFRFVKLDKENGILIIPFRVTSYLPVVLEEGEDEEDEKEDPNYNGFILLDVTPDGISERFRIPHKHPVYYRIGCYQSVQLAERNFVVGGKVITLKGHSVQTHNLDPPYELLDSIDLDVYL